MRAQTPNTSLQPRHDALMEQYLDLIQHIIQNDLNSLLPYRILIFDEPPIDKNRANPALYDEPTEAHDQVLFVHIFLSVLEREIIGNLDRIWHEHIKKPAACVKAQLVASIMSIIAFISTDLIKINYNCESHHQLDRDTCKKLGTAEVFLLVSMVLFCVTSLVSGYFLSERNQHLVTMPLGADDGQTQKLKNIFELTSLRTYGDWKQLLKKVRTALKEINNYLDAHKTREALQKEQHDSVQPSSSDPLLPRYHPETARAQHIQQLETLLIETEQKYTGHGSLSYRNIVSQFMPRLREHVPSVYGTPNSSVLDFST